MGEIKLSKSTYYGGECVVSVKALRLLDQWNCPKGKLPEAFFRLMEARNKGKKNCCDRYHYFIVMEDEASFFDANRSPYWSEGFPYESWMTSLSFKLVFGNKAIVAVETDRCFGGYWAKKGPMIDDWNLHSY